MVTISCNNNNNNNNNDDDDDDQNLLRINIKHDASALRVLSNVILPKTLGNRQHCPSCLTEYRTEACGGEAYTAV